MLTDATKAVFAKDLQKVDDLHAGFTTQERIDRIRTETLKHNADYEAMFDQAVAALTGHEGTKLRYACEFLRVLGGEECRSGTVAFAYAVDTLARLGIPKANYFYEHDRKWLVAQYMPAKETTE